MIALGFGVLIIAAIFYAVTGNPTVFWVTLAALTAGLIIQARRGVLILTCPHCRHGTKPGASVCGHCGRALRS